MKLHEDDENKIKWVWVVHNIFSSESSIYMVFFSFFLRSNSIVFSQPLYLLWEVIFCLVYEAYASLKRPN